MPHAKTARTLARDGTTRSSDIAALFERGEYAQAATIYDSTYSAKTAPLEASLYRARVHMRMNGESPKALALLNRLRGSAKSEQLIRVRMLLGEVYGTTGDFEAADEELHAAFEAAKRSGKKDLIADVAYRYGRRYALSSNQPEEARQFLQPIRSGGSVESRLNALQLESCILSREGRAREQAHVLTEMLRMIDPQDPEHAEPRIRGTQTLAALAREIYIPEAVPVVEQQLGGVPWPKDFEVALFQTTKAIGWAKALQGDYFNAFRYLRRSALAAPDLGWKTMALVDRAFLAQAREQDVWFRQELSDAEEAADQANWESCPDEAVLALLNLAELLAPIDAAKSSEYLARFRASGPIRNMRSLMRNDRRYQALIDYSTGVVDAYLGNRTLGRSRLKDALGVFESCGFEWRAGRTALRLYDFTKKPDFLKRAAHSLHHYASSWLGEELRKRLHSVNERADGLTPMQDKVFRLICEGLSNIDIGHRLEISPATVANHAKAVLKVFKVSSRHALIAEAMRRKII
jgi:DNA-binding CsgD family transcriptional regulator